MKELVMIVEDEVEINNAIQIYLKTQGYEVLQAYNGKEALDICNENHISLAIVDLMMPVMDGTTFIMKAREQYDFPIIILSAKSEDLDKITHLNIGADDYVTKPFVPMELLARVNSQLRRYRRYSKPVAESVLVVGGLELNRETKQVSVDGKIIKVTPKEFQILELLMTTPNKVFSAENIYESIWKEDAIDTDTVMVHIRNLRRKIEPDPRHPIYLQVVWGIGYKIEKKD